MPNNRRALTIVSLLLSFSSCRSAEPVRYGHGWKTLHVTSFVYSGGAYAGFEFPDNPALATSRQVIDFMVAHDGYVAHSDVKTPELFVSFQDVNAVLRPPIGDDKEDSRRAEPLYQKLRVIQPELEKLVRKLLLTGAANADAK